MSGSASPQRRRKGEREESWQDQNILRDAVQSGVGRRRARRLEHQQVQPAIETHQERGRDERERVTAEASQRRKRRELAGPKYSARRRSVRRRPSTRQTA